MSVVVSVNINSQHTFSKQPVAKIVLIAGEGIEGDAQDRDLNGNLIRKAGIMSVVVKGGAIASGDH